MRRAPARSPTQPARHGVRGCSHLQLFTILLLAGAVLARGVELQPGPQQIQSTGGGSGSEQELQAELYEPQSATGSVQDVQIAANVATGLGKPCPQNCTYFGGCPARRHIASSSRCRRRPTAQSARAYSAVRYLSARA